MPSHSFGRWVGERSEALDEIENAHLSVGGSARGRRYATQQINHAYATLLSAQFQGLAVSFDLATRYYPGPEEDREEKS